MHAPKQLTETICTGPSIHLSFCRYNVQISWKEIQYLQYIEIFSLSLWRIMYVII